MKTAEVMSEITSHAESIRNGAEKIKPGDPAYFTRGCVPGDRIWQGDLGITLVSFDTTTPAKSIKAGVRMAPDNGTIGSNHALDSLDGVTFSRGLPTSEDSLDGPAFVTTEPRIVTHPKHGWVHLCPGTYDVGYQRELDRDLATERRAQD